MNKAQDWCEGGSVEKFETNHEDIATDADNDLISAYFRQRSNSNIYFKQTESERNSSLGVLDIDDLSKLEKISRFSGASLNLRDSFKNININRKSLLACDQDSETTNYLKNNPYMSIVEPSESELNLIKQRELAKKALLQHNKRLENITKTVSPVKDKSVDMNSKNSNGQKKSLVGNFTFNGKMKRLFDHNQSPQTPMFFRDELNSMNGTANNCSINPENSQQPCSESTEVNTPFTCVEGINHGIRTSEFSFNSLSPGEIISRFEEDEKKFIKEQSALSNDSKVSHFSGLMGNDAFTRWSGCKKDVLENERISIGKYFEMRSNSINSLIGAKDLKETESSLAVCKEDGTEVASAPSDAMNMTPEADRTIFTETCTISNEPNRYSCDPKSSEVSSHGHHSYESSASTTTLLIQNILRGMDSGLSGTQINDRLIQCVNEIKNEKKKDENNLAKHLDPPKPCYPVRKLVKSPKEKLWKSEGIDQNIFTSDDSKENILHPLEKSEEINEIFGSEVTASELKNKPISSQLSSKVDRNILSLKNEKIHKLTRGFESSTPKFEGVHTQKERFKSACSKLLISDKDWEPPRVSSISKPILLNKDISLEANNRLGVLNTTDTENSKLNDILINKEIPALEDTIPIDDMTILSERIIEMQQEETHTICPSDTGEMSILDIVQELAKFPKGTIDCSSLTPVLCMKYPKFLSNKSLQASFIKGNDSMDLKVEHELSVPIPGAWVNMPSTYGVKNRLCIPVEIKRAVVVPVKNLTNDWLIISVESLSIRHPNGKYLHGKRIEDEYIVGDFLSISMKDTLIPPNELHQCKIYITPKVPIILKLNLKLNLKKLRHQATQAKDIVIRACCIFPKENIAITPKSELNFGVIPEQCIKEKDVEIIFDGICDLPLKIFIDKSQNFTFNSDLQLDGEGIKIHEFKDHIFHCTLKEGGQRVLKFKVNFRQCLSKGTVKQEVDVKGILSVNLDAPVGNCILKQISLFGSLGYAQFLCNPSCSPLMFRTTEIGRPVTRSFPLKNVGSVDIEFSIHVCDSSSQVQTDDLFIVPKSFTLSKNEERSFDIIFSGNTKGNYVRRYLILQMQPNGQTLYDVELIGVVMPPPVGKSLSVFSNHSGPANSLYNVGNVVFKLKSTTQSICWGSVPLDTESKQTYTIMNSSSANAVARFSFRKLTSSFRFLNDNGEPIEKLRKVLKPNCSNVMTVIFRPDSVGPHVNSIIIETNNISGKKMISLNGYGGSHKIFIRNIKSDLNGYKIIRLNNSEPENQIFRASVEFVNKGNISGFVSIKTISRVFSFSNELKIEPADFVVHPNTKAEVQIYQKLKNDDIKRLLSGRDIGKLATITVTTSDEVSRCRLRKLVREKKIETSDSIRCLLIEFHNEINEDTDKFDDEKLFESIFLKALETVEITAVIERPTDIYEPTMLEDFEETVKEFVTILPAADYSISSTRDSGTVDNTERSPCKAKYNMEKNDSSVLSGESSNSQDRKIAKWLATLDMR